jgi:predicted nucleic acid-binding protein
MLYFDTSYAVRLYTKDVGWEKVRALAASDSVACCTHGRAEVVAAFHRKFREGAINRKELGDLITEFNRDCEDGAFDWLVLSSVLMERLVKTYTTLPAAVHLRAADAIHLACAAENGFMDVYSNDTHLLKAAAFFGIKGINII